MFSVMKNSLFNILAAADLGPAKDQLQGFFDAVPNGIWTVMAYLGGALILISLIMTGISYVQQAAQGGRGGGGGGQQNKTLGKMIVFGVLMAGPQTWMPIAISLVVAILQIVLDMISTVAGQL